MHGRCLAAMQMGSPFASTLPALAAHRGVTKQQRPTSLGAGHVALTIPGTAPQHHPTNSSQMPSMSPPGGHSGSGPVVEQSALSNCGRFGLRGHLEAVMQQSALLTSLVRLRGGPPAGHVGVAHPGHIERMLAALPVRQLVC